MKFNEKNPAPSDARKADRENELMKSAVEGDLFCTPQGESYGTVDISGHLENHPLNSEAFKQLLRYQYFRKT